MLRKSKHKPSGLQIVDDLIENIDKFVSDRRSNRVPITWHDYEVFKQYLHHNNIYGYEQMIIDLLGL